MKRKMMLIVLALLMLLQCACGVSTETETEIETEAEAGTETEAPAETDGETESETDTEKATETEGQTETAPEGDIELIVKPGAPAEEVFAVKAETFVYVRGGTNGDKTYAELSTSTPDQLILKRNSEGGNTNNDREIYLQFNLWKYKTKIDKVTVADLQLIPKSLAMAALAVDIYFVKEEVDLSKITFNTRPLGEKVEGASYILPSLYSYNFIDLVDRAFDECDGFLTLRLVGKEVYTASESKIQCGKGNEPYLEFGGSSSFVYDLVEDEEENKAIWVRAQQMYNEWYERYQQILAEIPNNPVIDRIESDMSQFTMKVNSYGTNASTKNPTSNPTRTFDALKDMNQYVNPADKETYDKYGGLMEPSLKQEATGFFYTKKLGDRWWVIDPLGYPCQIRGVSGVTPQYSSGSPNQQSSAIAKYGSLDRWGIAAVERLKDGLYFNTTTSTNKYVLAADDPLIEQLSLGGGFVKNYAKVKNIYSSKGGSTTLSENNTMPVFSSDFAEYCDDYAYGNTKPHLNKSNFIGYTTDNELPMDEDMLTDYLTLDISKKVNHDSYACAWTWLCNMTGKEQPTQADITDEMYQLFRGFVWDRYYYVVCSAVRKYDPNHMILGTRFLTRVKDAEWALRFAGQYLDIMTINWYRQWEADADALWRISTYSDLPIMITEFYAKAKENEGNLSNTDTSAGWLVETQSDRGYFYQNFTLRLLECKNVIGWHWFQYLDCDPEGNQTDVSSQNSNKGMYSNTHNEYTDLTEKMAVINKNVYRLIDYFDQKYAK